MLIDVTTLELKILQACNRLQFGIFKPYEPEPSDGEIHSVRAHPSQFNLVEHTRKWGVPIEISVADGFPTWAVFEIKEDVGIGHKRIKCN
jgi:hypothetical protein